MADQGRSHVAGRGPLDIALASDERGAEGVVVAGWSAMERASRPVRLWVIDDNISRPVQERMAAAWSRSPNCMSVSFTSLHALPLKYPSYWTRGRWPMSSCSRFQIASVLPADATRCVYLDYDTVTGTDIAELIDIDMGGNPVGMVPNFRVEEKVADYIRTLGLDPAKYCNAGVMLFDVTMWRAQDYASKLIAHGTAMAPDIWFFDQDMLNSFFKDRTLLLDERWNLRDAAAEAEGNVLHFAGAEKPWSVPPERTLPGHRAWLDCRSRIDFQPAPPPARRNRFLYWLVSCRARIQRRLLSLMR